jgi:ADP-ribose diphosphatase
VVKREEYFWLVPDEHGETFIQSRDEVLVLPIDANGDVLFALEPAPAFGGEQVLILPGGTVEPEETLADTANRELQEELGFAARHLQYLGELRPWSKYLSVRSHLFLGRDLVLSKLPGDELEPVGIRRVPWAETNSLVLAGQLRDARAIAALHLAQIARDAGNVPAIPA